MLESHEWSSCLVACNDIQHRVVVSSIPRASAAAFLVMFFTLHCRATVIAPASLPMGRPSRGLSPVRRVEIGRNARRIGTPPMHVAFCNKLSPIRIRVPPMGRPNSSKRERVQRGIEGVELAT